MRACFSVSIAFQRLADSIRVENGDRRTTVGTSVFRADIDAVRRNPSNEPCRSELQRS